MLVFIECTSSTFQGTMGQVVRDATVETLMNDINQLIKEGWIIAGVRN